MLSPVLALGGAPLAGWAVPGQRAALAFGEVGGRSGGVRGCDRESGILPCFLLVIHSPSSRTGCGGRLGQGMGSCSVALLFRK